MAKLWVLLLTAVSVCAQSSTSLPPRIVEIKVPANIAANAEASRAGVPGVLALKAVVALPQGFDPRLTWPVLLITAPSGASAVQSLGAYTNTALALGWVVTAVIFMRRSLSPR